VTPPHPLIHTRVRVPKPLLSTEFVWYLTTIMEANIKGFWAKFNKMPANTVNDLEAQVRSLQTAQSLITVAVSMDED
jgi:hypothetical protein